LAQKFEELGAKWLHIVDLNGAFAGEPKNLEAIKKIRENSNLHMQLGGGIRDEETIKRYMDLGIERVILGSIAAKNADFVKEMAKKYKIVVGLDAIDGFVAVEGWAKTSTMKATELAKAYADSGVEAIICTDVGKDGTLSGVNVEFTLSIAKASSIDTIASGGVRDINDIKVLLDTGLVAGVIVGKAFYEGSIDLKEAFELVGVSR
jgi:phosphoribosylformimino-5-aminoimidazole carboxamide ribotide isomerase